MSLADHLPYSSDYTVRKQIDELFSRQMLGAVLVGKFAGDLSAVVMTGFLGTYIGLGVGLVVTISLFIYWERVERAAREYSKKAEEYAVSDYQSRLSDHEGFTDYQLDENNSS